MVQSLLNFVLFLFMVFLISALTTSLIFYFAKSTAYHHTVYYQITHHSLLKIMLSKGLRGEYLTYKNLRKLAGNACFLFNLYLPKENDETTEIDVLLIHESGLYVFESKNYSGWIFGSENQKTWTQSLPRGRSSIKNHFLNPIMQNKLHIKYLKVYLSDFPDLIYHSFILFSDRCALKKITITDGQAEVMNRRFVLKHVAEKAAENGALLTRDEIESIYETLYPYTQTSKEQRQVHIQNILANHKPKNPGPKQDIKITTPLVHETVEPNTAMQITEQSATQEKICPKCGKSLILRTAKRGAHAGEHFWGCLGYPHCRYTEKDKS